MSIIHSNTSTAIAIITDKYSYTYKEYNDITNKIAFILHTKYNVQKQNTVGVQLFQSVEYLFLIIALQKLETIACYINPKFPFTTSINLLETLNISILITDSIIENSTNKTIININTIIEEALKLENNPIYYNTNYNNPTNIIFTSGSSGQPKAVTHSINNHLFSAKGSNENIILNKGDVWFISLPFFHVSGLSIIYRTAISNTSILISNSKFPDVLEKYYITHLSLTPTQLIRVIHNKKWIPYLQKLKAILLGGAPIPSFLLEESKKLDLNIFCTYGSSEMSSQITTTSKQDISLYNNNAGKILKYRNLKIVSNKEILVSGETLFLGYAYYNTNTKVIEYKKELIDDIWFATKDLGLLNAQDELIVLGRMDNMFISGGENIQPEEIEHYIYKYPLIEHAIVVPKKDIEYGYRPICYLSWLDNTISLQKIKQEISLHLQKYLPKFKLPINYYILPEEYKDIKINRKKLHSLST